MRRQLENERDLHTIQSVFAEKAAPVGRRSRLEAQRKRIQTTLSQLGMAGEKGARDIVELCMLLLEQGQQVSQGQTIAKVGSTGYSTGPHLHFGIRHGGRYVNPQTYVSP